MKKIYYFLAFSIFFLNAHAIASFGPSLPLMEKMVTWKKQAFDNGIEKNKAVTNVIQLIDTAISDCGLQIQGGKVTSASKRSSYACGNSHSNADQAMRKLDLTKKETVARLKAEAEVKTRATVTVGMHRVGKPRPKAVQEQR